MIQMNLGLASQHREDKKEQARRTEKEQPAGRRNLAVWGILGRKVSNNKPNAANKYTQVREGLLPSIEWRLKGTRQ